MVKGPVAGKKPSDKSSPPGQAPEHEPNHAHVDDHLAGGAKQLIVLAQPTALALPGEGALNDPAARQHPKAGR